MSETPRPLELHYLTRDEVKALAADPENWRLHPEGQAEGLVAAAATCPPPGGVSEERTEGQAGGELLPGVIAYQDRNGTAYQTRTIGATRVAPGVKAWAA